MSSTYDSPGRFESFMDRITITPSLVRFCSSGLLLLLTISISMFLMFTPSKDLVLSSGWMLVMIGALLLSCIGNALLFSPARKIAYFLAIVTAILFTVQMFGEPLGLFPFIASLLCCIYLRRYEVEQYYASFVSPIRSSSKTKALGRYSKTAFTHLFLFLAVLIATFPVVWVIGTSLKPGNTLIDTELEIFSSDITFEHYHDVIFVENFHVYLLNSIICAAGTALLTIFLSTTGAYALSKFRFKGKKSVLLSFVVVQMFPGVIIIIPYFILLNNLGLLNSYLGLIAAYSVTALPLCVWMIKGFFDTVPDDLIEAARVDGYSHSQIFRKIMLPLAKPAIAVTTLFAFLAAWNEYVLAYTFMSDESYYTLPVKIFMYIGGANVKWGTFAAMSVLVSIPVVILFILFQKYLIGGMTKGAVKG